MSPASLFSQRPSLQVERRFRQAGHGINGPTHRAAYESFLATQSHPYHRQNPLPGQQWGDVIYVLANATKHLKLTAQSVSEKLRQATHGSFRRMDTKIMVETPARDIYSWSFMGYRQSGARRGIQARRKARTEGPC